LAIFIEIAANRFATITVIGQQLRFVADANLSHLNPSLKLFGQLSDQFAKIDTLFGQIINDNTLATQDMFQVDQLHFKAEFFDHGLAFGKLRTCLSFHVRQLIFIVGGHAADDFTLFRVSQPVDSVIGGLAQDFTRLKSPLGAGDDAFSAGEGLILAANRENSQCSHQSVTNDVFWHDLDPAMPADGEREIAAVAMPAVP
jgi:hypothetical protein